MIDQNKPTGAETVRARFEAGGLKKRMVAYEAATIDVELFAAAGDRIAQMKAVDQVITYGRDALLASGDINLALPILQDVVHRILEYAPLSSGEANEASEKAKAWEGVYGEHIAAAAKVLMEIIPVLEICRDVLGNSHYNSLITGLIGVLNEFYTHHPDDHFSPHFAIRYGEPAQAYAALERYKQQHPLGGEQTDHSQFASLVSLTLGRAVDNFNLPQVGKRLLETARLLFSGKMAKGFVLKESVKNFSQEYKRRRNKQRRATLADQYANATLGSSLDVVAFMRLRQQQYAAPSAAEVKPILSSS